MSQDIHRQLFDLYNPTDRPIPLIIKSTSSTPIVDNSSDYYVCVEKVEIPINNRFMPINANDFDYNICIFNEYKETDRPFTNLSYLANYFSFSGPFYSVDEFLKKVNDIILKKALPEVNLGSIERDEEDDELFVYVYDKIDADEFDMLKIYFDAKLMKLFKFDYNLTDTIIHNGIEYFRFSAVTSFTPTPTSTITSVSAKENTYSNFFNLKSIRIYSNLPTTATKVFDIVNKTVVDSDMLTDITFNTVTNYNLKNLIYIPQQFRLSSMENSGAVRNVELRFSYYYSNGKEYAVYLDSLEYASACLSYIKKTNANNIF